MEQRNSAGGDAQGLRPLSQTQSAILAVGALLMVLGIGGVVFGSFAGVTVVRVATVMFAVGALAFAFMQMTQTYSGNNIVIRRLRHIMVIGDICFIVAALLMVENNFQIVFPYVAKTIDGYNAWVHYVYNNWVIALLIAALIEMYTTHRIANEIKKLGGE